MIIKRFLVYLWNKLFDFKIDVINRLFIIKDKVYSMYKKSPTVNSIEDTINEIVNKKASVSRYGDGEFKLINGIDISFQKNNKTLKNRLREVLKSSDDTFIVCIPDVFKGLDQYSDEPKEYWKLHISKYRSCWYKIISFDKIYGNAFISRCYYPLKDKTNSEKYFSLLKKIWNNREIVLVEGRKSRLGIGNDLFNNAISIERILVPEIDAFNKYNNILNQVKKVNKDKLILLAAGPTATILAYDLHIEGYQAIDIGHIDIEYEWFLRKATEKIQIKNKFVCEAGFGKDVGELKDNEYTSQIISVI